MSGLSRLDFPERSRKRELIDEREPQGDDLRRMLDELGVINRRLGGIGSSLHAIDKVVGAEQGVSIVDVGTGGGEFPDAFRRHFQSRARMMLGCDRSVATCARAARRFTRGVEGPGFVAADAFRLPLRNGSFDIAHCSLFLHHFTGEEIGRLLREMLRVARLGVLVNDLHRSRLAEGGIRVLTRALSRSRFIRNDAPLSVRRSFTRDDILAIWRDQGLPAPDVRWRWAFRYLVWTEKAEGS